MDQNLSLLFWSVAFSPDGRRLALGSADGAVKVIDRATGKEMVSLKGPGTGGIRSVTFGPDGQRLISGSEDGTVKIWDRATGKEKEPRWTQNAEVQGFLREAEALLGSPKPPATK